MRILTIVQGLGPGGTERVAQNCAVAYARRGHGSAVFAYSYDGPRRAFLTEAGIPVFIGGEDRAACSRALGDAAAWRPDILHIHRPGLPDTVSGGVLREFKQSAQARGRRLPVVETNHFARADESADRALIDAHIQISRWCLWQWRRWSNDLRPRPIGVLVPHMVPADVFRRAPDERIAAFRREIGVPADALLFGRLGQSYPGIWPPELVGVFERVARADRRAWLLLVGSPDALSARIDALPAAIRARVVRLPFIFGDERLRDCYSALDAFLHVTRIGDSFGLVLCEAMLCGTPVVTLSTPARGNSQLEVVGHECGGLVCADLASVPVAMRALADDPALRRRLGRQGGDRVRRQFDPERITDALLRVLDAAARHAEPEALLEALHREPAMVTDVSWSEILALRDTALGRTPLKQRLLMHAVGVPQIHRFVRRLRPPPKGRFQNPAQPPESPRTTSAPPAR